MNKYDCIIRKETKDDYRETENLAREAFWNLSQPGCNEHYLMLPAELCAVFRCGQVP